MLAELQQLSRSLARLQIAPDEVHKWVKPIPRGPFLIAKLDGVGTVREVELNDSTGDSTITTIRKDNHNSFPAFKLRAPLFEIASDHAARQKLKSADLTNAERAEILRGVCADAQLIHNASRDSIKHLLQTRRFALEELKPKFEPHFGRSRALERLFAALSSSSFSAEAATREIANAVITAVQQGESSSLAERALIGTVKKSGKIEPEDLIVLLDAWQAPDETFLRTSHPDTREVYNSALLSDETAGADGICGLSGEQQKIERGTLPSPRLPSISDTILFSVFDQIPALTRYRLIGSHAFPIGKATAQNLNNAALWITSKSREGKTWATVPRNDDTKSDLLLAYIDSYPELEANLAYFLAEQKEAAYEAVAQSVIDALEKQKLRERNAILRTIVLRRISKGQVQVELSREYHVERIFQANRDWQTAASNLPSISILVPTAKGQPPAEIAPRAPFPSQITQATKSIWTQSSGAWKAQPIVGCTLETVYDLYLGDANLARHAAKQILTLLLQRYTRLLIFAGDQFARHGRATRDIPAPARRDVVFAATILGIALYKLGHRKDTYMPETAFLLGRMLALSDLVHAKYCQVVRGGSLPPQLLGNQHYSMAAEHPSRALAVLGDRLKIYQGWAAAASVQSQSENELKAAVKAAKWAVKRLGEVTPQLHGKLPEQGFSYAERAEMLLGYLSRDRKEEEGKEEKES